MRSSQSQTAVTKRGLWLLGVWAFLASWLFGFLAVGFSMLFGFWLVDALLFVAFVASAFRILSTPASPTFGFLNFWLVASSLPGFCRWGGLLQEAKKANKVTCRKKS